MKKTLTIFITCLIALAVVGGAWMLIQLSHSATPTSQPSTNTGVTPSSNNTTSVTSTNNNATSSTNSGATMQILIRNGKSLVVKDFVHNGETAPDKVNPGYFYLAGSIGYCLGDGTCPSGYKTDDFSITYHNTDGHFNITLLKEPLAKSRSEAEVFMLDRLGISEALLCNTNYWIGTTELVNALYAGKNLGFDFCPGATGL